ncbi:MAG TPA: hypothetical protein VMR33_10175 [Candidatus Baltobacteraceae bacterium]|jgi:hypothetical protein|nr:hypothetical protein [Candidatus Baltobacteraceae bacterium]
MNKLRFIIVAGLIAVAAASPAPAQQPVSTNTPADSLFFRDGDMLYGKLLAIEPRNAIRWQHPDASEPIEFKADSVAQIQFPSPKPTVAQSNSSCRVYFGNGDTMEGNLVSCDKDTLTMQTWYAGRLTISRTIPQDPVQTVAFLPRQPAMFDGLTGMDGWTQGNAVKAFANDSGQWLYRHGAFYANKPASIARDFNLPDRSIIQFDLAWKGSFNLAVALYTDSLQPILLAAKDQGPDFGAFYSLRIQSPYFIALTPIRKNDVSRSLGDLIVPSLSNRDRVHIDLRISKPDHRIVLFLDGVMIKEWITPAGFNAEGTGLRFVQNGGGSIKLSHLRVAAWNGVLDEAPAVSPDSTHDIISMEAGAKISGVIQTIANGQISLLGAGGLTKIPVNTVSAIDFAGVATEAPKTAPGSVHATFARGGFVTFDLLSWRPDAISVTSPVFGKATFDPAAFSRLQFVAPEPKSADEPKG